MSEIVTVQYAAARLADLLKALQPGEEITVTGQEGPMAVITRLPKQNNARRGFGSCKGMLIENPDVPEDAYLEDFKEYL